MPSVVDVQTAPGIPTGAAPPPDSSSPNGLDTVLEDATNEVANGVPAGAPAADLDDDENKGNLYENAPKKDSDEDEDEGGVLIGPNGPVDANAPVLEDPEDPVNGPAADKLEDMQEATVSGKKKKKGRSTAARGPTALPKRCGTGFEGEWSSLCFFIIITNAFSLPDFTILYGGCAA